MLLAWEGHAGCHFGQDYAQRSGTVNPGVDDQAGVGIRRK